MISMCCCFAMTWKIFALLYFGFPIVGMQHLHSRLIVVSEGLRAVIIIIIIKERFNVAFSK